MKKVLVVLAVALFTLSSCEKEPVTCTCDLVSYEQTNNGWKEVTKATITAESLCDQEGNQTVLTQNGITVKSVYENCKQGYSNTSNDTRNPF